MHQIVLNSDKKNRPQKVDKVANKEKILETKDNHLLFNSISSIYGLFYNVQVKNFVTIFKRIKDELKLNSYKNVIDIGCGTGALCNVLNKYGLDVTGIDPAIKMIEIANKRNQENDIKFIQANVLTKLPFEDNSFDIAISSFVSHGLSKKERMIMYDEMNRVSRHLIIIYDYNEHRSLHIDFIEWLEGGDYFNFIKEIKSELKDKFGNLSIVNANIRSSLYIYEKN